MIKVAVDFCVEMLKLRKDERSFHKCFIVFTETTKWQQLQHSRFWVALTLGFCLHSLFESFNNVLTFILHIDLSVQYFKMLLKTPSLYDVWGQIIFALVSLFNDI